MPLNLIIHGTPDREEFYDPAFPAPAHAHWIPWLHNQFEMNDLHAQAPAMPRAWRPNYEAWKETFEYFPICAESVLVGHSCGGGFLLRYLSENKIRVKRTVLVAPWLDPTKRKDPAFFDFTLDPDLTTRTELHLLHSDDDDESIHKSVAQIRESLPDLHYHEYSGYGHFCIGDMGTDAFPELRDIALYGKREAHAQSIGVLG